MIRPRRICADCGKMLWYRPAVITVLGHAIYGWSTVRGSQPRPLQCKKTKRLHRPEGVRMPEGIALTERVVQRINEVFDHIEQMERERAGYGPDAEREVNATRTSFQRALAILLTSNEVWIDWPEGFSFGGNLEGIIYGMIARPKESLLPATQFAPYEWALHS